MTSRLVGIALGEELDQSDLDSEYSEIEYDIDHYSDVEVELPDITYDLSDATEL